MSPPTLAWLTAACALFTCAALYLFILRDAFALDEWIHIMTLTPLMPFLVVFGLAYRHRGGRLRAALLLLLTLVLAAVALPVYWRYFTPETDHVTKALVKGALPIGLTALTVVAGALLEWRYRWERKQAGARANMAAAEFTPY
jgi:hypothetical protein